MAGEYLTPKTVLNQFWYTADMIYMGVGQKYVIYIGWCDGPGLHITNRVPALGYAAVHKNMKTFYS